MDYAKLIPYLRSFALKKTQDPDAADDLVQNTCERILKKEHTFKGNSDPKTWATRIMLNLFYDSKRASRPYVREEDEGETVFGVVPPQQERGLNISDAFARIEELAPKHRRAVTALVTHGTYAKAAAALRIPPMTLGTRVFYGKLMLHERPDPLASPRRRAPVNPVSTP